MQQMAFDGVATRPAAEREPNAQLDQPAKGSLPNKILLAFAALLLVICGGLLVYGSGRGLDLTDEIFYLIWARDQNAYALMYQPFGYLLHPLFKLTGGDLQTYRLAGFAIAAGAGALLGDALSASRGRLAFPVYGAASALTIFFPWIITPSYNSAANVGALLTITGILNSRSDHSGRGLLGAIALGVGLFVSAFAKPPLFAVSIGAVLLIAVFARTVRTKWILAAGLLAGVVLAALLVGVDQIQPLLRRIVATQQILSLPNTPLALPQKLVHDWMIVPSLLSFAIIPAAIGLAAPQSRVTKLCAYAAAALSLIYIGRIATDALDGSIPDFLGLAMVTAFTGYAGVLRGHYKVSLIPIVLLIGAPAAVALGTFNNQWAQLNFSLAFPFLGIFALAFADPVSWRKGFALGFSIAGPAAVMLLAACYPYNLSDTLFEQKISVTQPITHTPILVDEETADFVSSAEGAAKGALIIDLSGTGPGVAAVLGAQAPVLPWLNPGTPSWPDVVWSRLTPKQRDRAWFVGPVRKLFERSAPATWLLAHEPRYCRTTLASMMFWDEERTLEIWRPCTNAARPGPNL